MLVLAMAFFFAFPWLPEPSLGGAALGRYSPAHDGASLLVESYDKGGRLISTESQNLAMIPALRSFTESRQRIREELEEIYGSPGGRFEGPGTVYPLLVEEGRVRRGRRRGHLCGDGWARVRHG